MDVLLVAVKRDKVNDYVSVISQTGKSPVLVDVDAFAVQNAYEVNYDLDPRKVVALVNMGASVTNINILARGQTVVLARHLVRRQSVHRGAAARVQPRRSSRPSALKRGEPVDRYHVERRAAACSTRCRQRWPSRDPEDVRLLRRHLVARGRSTRSCCRAAAR